MMYAIALVGVLPLAVDVFGALGTPDDQEKQLQVAWRSEQLQHYQALAERNSWIRLPEATCLQPGDMGARILSLLRKQSVREWFSWLLV